MTRAHIPDFSQPVPVRVTDSGKPVRIRMARPYRDLPNEPIPGEIEAWEAVTPVRPDTSHSRSLRFIDVAGELLAAIVIIGGGMVLTGLASLL